MHRLCLAPLTLEPVTSAEHLDATARAGFDAVALRLRSPGGIVSTPPDPDLPRALPELKRQVRDSGLELFHVTGMWFQPETDIAAFTPVLDAAVELGAGRIVAAVNDGDPARARDRFAAICADAGARGLRIALEFLPYTKVRSLQEAAAFIISTGAANAGILVDALHLSRSGGSPADIAAVDPALISFVQLCDAPRQLPQADEIRIEARTRRLYPGDGELWLREMLDALPDDVVIDIEAPCAADAALTPGEKAKKAMDATRRFLNGYRRAR